MYEPAMLECVGGCTFVQRVVGVVGTYNSELMARKTAQMHRGKSDVGRAGMHRTEKRQ